MIWRVVGTVSITQKETWFPFPTPIPNELNLFRVQALGSQTVFLGNAYIRAFYPNFNLYSDKWQRIYPKEESEYFRFDPEQDFLPEKILQVNRPNNRYNTYSEPFILKLDYWDIAYKPEVNADLEDIFDQFEVQSSELVKIKNQIANLSLTNEEKLDFLLSSNSGQIQALKVLLNQVNNTEANDLAQRLTASNFLLTELFL